MAAPPTSEEKIPSFLGPINGVREVMWIKLGHEQFSSVSVSPLDRPT